MDILYILGSGSRFNNNELRYSLRTIEKFVSKKHNVIVVGENPMFLSNQVTFVPIPEAVGNKEYCIASKIATAIKQNIVTKDFLFMNDDFFLTAPINPAIYPYYYKPTLNEKTPTPIYQKSLLNTYNYLKNNGHTTKHFDIHTPIIYNPEKFLELQPAFDYSKTLEAGLVVKSLYGNIHQVPGVETIDCKIKKLETYPDFVKTFNHRKVFSIYDEAWVNGVEDYFEMKYPNKSRFEK